MSMFELPPLESSFSATTHFVATDEISLLLLFWARK